jgi:hypothetical protein
MSDFVTQHQFWAALILALLISASACAARYTVHPGALNKADSATYDTLLAAEAAIDQARTEFHAGQLPGKAKDALNALVQSYNLARESWLTYRGAITAKVPQETYCDKLTKNLSDLRNAIQALKEAK